MPNSFNDFFSNVSSKLAGELLNPHGPPLVDDTALRQGLEFRLDTVRRPGGKMC